MKHKRLVKVLLAFFLILPALCFAHFIIFPQETRCMLIGFSDFKKTGNIYYKQLSAGKLSQLQTIIRSAEKKDNIFWKENGKLEYKIIFCNKEDYSLYAPESAPAATYMKLGAYVVIKDESLDENIIAHEIAHTILYRNIGWYKRTFSIPAWFDEGLAMQTDDRDYYSIDTLLQKQSAGIKIPDVTALKKPSDFFSGDTEKVMLNFAAAKCVVRLWLQSHSLEKFIAAINEGVLFDDAYRSRSLAAPL